jgi:UDP-glucose:(heptosyl)LPS alpha-1,3-glucosyltransferase
LLASSFRDVPDGVTTVHLASRGPTRLKRYQHFLDALDQHLEASAYDVIQAMLPVRRCDLYHPHAGIAAEAVDRGHLKHAGPISQAMSRLANRANRKRRRFAAIERELLEKQLPPLVLCLSDYVRRSVERYYALPRSRAATLMNSVDVHRFDPSRDPQARSRLRQELGIADEKPVALLIAQDFQRKGLREAVLAWRQLSAERLVLLVVGKDNPRKYAALVDGSPHRSNVIFAGEAADPYPYYRAADWFVLPTRHDPCSLVVLEALAMGLPVISTVFNGACEVMTDGTHGYVLNDPADVGAVAAAMTSLVDPQRRAAMSSACLALRPRLAYEHHLDRLLEIYAQIARRSGGGCPSD